MKNKISFVVVLVSLLLAVGCGSSVGIALNAKAPDGSCAKEGASERDRNACLMEQISDLHRVAKKADEKATSYKEIAAARQQELEERNKPDCDKLTSDMEKVACLKTQVADLKAGPKKGQQAQQVAAGPLAPNGMGMQFGQGGVHMEVPMGPSNRTSAENLFRIDNVRSSLWYVDVPAGMQPYVPSTSQNQFVRMLVQRGGRIEARWMCPPRTSCLITRQLDTTMTAYGPRLIGQDGPRDLVFDVYYSPAAGQPLAQMGRSITFTPEFPGMVPGFMQNITLSILNVNSMQR